MSDHGIVWCKVCKMIIRQCRCPGPHAEQWGICESCAVRTYAPEPLITKEEALTLLKATVAPGESVGARFSVVQELLSPPHDLSDGESAMIESRDAEIAETRRLLDLREQQLADCTRAMREVSDVLRSSINTALKGANFWAVELFERSADKLDAARAGKAGT